MKFEVKTYGCKVNQYEGQLLRENLEGKGHVLSFNGEADAVLVNTCCVTAKAEKEARAFIRKSIAGGKKVWVTGCGVLKDDGLRKLFPSAGFYPDKRLLIEELSGLRTISRFDGHTRAFVKIEDGCENFCSYCIVPLVRGRVESRPPGEILTETESLVLNGYREIVLTGIDLGAYGKETGSGLVPLLEELRGVRGLKRIRLSSIEVFHLSDDLAEVLASDEIFCPHFHVPLQSGSDRILKMMNRRYSFSEYMGRMETIRSKYCKGRRVTFTTDLMVGFPGERDDDFRLTCRAVEEAGFLRAHIFRYSRREGTAACLMAGGVPEEVKKSREKELEGIVRKVSGDVKRMFAGSRLDVLVERRVENGWEGYSSEYIPVEFKGEGNLINEVVAVEAKGVRGDFVEGEKMGGIPDGHQENC